MMSFAEWGNALYTGDKSYPIVQRRKLFLGVSGALVALALILIVVLGVNRSIEFTGGSQFTVAGATQVSEQTAHDAVGSTGLAQNIRVSRLGADSIRVQTDSLNSESTATVRTALATAYGVAAENVESSSIGPSWGMDVTTKAAQSLLIFLGLVSLLMAAYFRSWTMALSAIVALLHDIIVTIAFFSIVRVEVSPATVIGFLTILGYSLYDTVVVFDKVRELTKDIDNRRDLTFPELVNLAVNQTMVRSINTSVVALLPVGAILLIGSLLLGAGTLMDISLALFIGMIAGTYSSIFIASPLLVALENWRGRYKEHDEAVEKARQRAADKARAAGEPVPAVPTGPAHAGRRLPNSAQPKRKKHHQ